MRSGGFRETWLPAALLVLSGCGSDGAPSAGDGSEIRPGETLASRAEPHGVRMGTLLWVPEQRSDTQRAIASTEYDLLTVPAFFRVVQAERGNFDFSVPDQTADFAGPTTALRVHNLIWCNLLPDPPDAPDPQPNLPDPNRSWVAALSGEELEALLVSHVTQVVEHYETKYPSKIVSYDVVNEPFSYEGDTCPWNRIGLEAGRDALHYVRLALETARSAAPSAKLCINDFHIEGLGEKSDRMFEFAAELKRDGVPLDCVGLQSHFVIGSDELTGEMPPPGEIAVNMARYAEIGVRSIITEADFALRDADVSVVSVAAQASAYRGLLGACLASAGCDEFVVWGVQDDDSWIPMAHPGWGRALPFDAAGQPKPAYYALMRELEQAPRLAR